MLLALKLNLRSTCENNKRSNLDHNLKNNGENRVAVCKRTLIFVLHLISQRPFVACASLM